MIGGSLGMNGVSGILGVSGMCGGEESESDELLVE